MAGNGSVSRVSDGEELEDHRDRISELPDALLHLILVLVPLVDAVRTCVLSRRWRSVWTRLPQLRFDDFQRPRVSRFQDLVAGVLRRYSAAAAAAAGGLHIGDLFVSVHRRDSILVDDPVRFVAATADFAADRAVRRLHIYLSPAAVNLYAPEVDDDDSASPAAAAAALMLPCFPELTELFITFTGVALGLPTAAAGTFAKLTRLFLSGVRLADGGGDLSTVVSSQRCCPCLATLELHGVGGLKWLTVLTRSLVRMVLSKILVLEQLVLDAGNLRHMAVDNCFVMSNTARRAILFLNVPALEKLFWQDRCPEVVRHRVLPACLRRLVVAELQINYLLAAGGDSHFARILERFSRVHTLRLEFPFAQLIGNVNLPSYSELEFMVSENRRHTFGPAILDLLRKCTSVNKVTLQLSGREVIYIPCASNCYCRRVSVWADKAISLDSLEWVAMYECGATQDERSFIYYIMRNANRLRKVYIQFSLGANPTRRFFRKLCKLSALSGCTVECLLPLKVRPAYAWRSAQPIK